MVRCERCAFPLFVSDLLSMCPAVGGVFQYYIKVVPTIYSDVSSSVQSYQVRRKLGKAQGLF